jgi:hypothetical protein
LTQSAAVDSCIAGDESLLMHDACLRGEPMVSEVIIFVFLIGGMKNEIFLDASVKNTNMVAKNLG